MRIVSASSDRTALLWEVGKIGPRAIFQAAHARRRLVLMLDGAARRRIVLLKGLGPFLRSTPEAFPRAARLKEARREGDRKASGRPLGGLDALRS